MNIGCLMSFRTSPSQWQVIDLLEEVLYDSEDSRMFFMWGIKNRQFMDGGGCDYLVIWKKFGGRLEIEGMNESWHGT